MCIMYCVCDLLMFILHVSVCNINKVGSTKIRYIGTHTPLGDRKLFWGLGLFHLKGYPPRTGLYILFPGGGGVDFSNYWEVKGGGANFPIPGGGGGLIKKKLVRGHRTLLIGIALFNIQNKIYKKVWIYKMKWTYF